MPASIVSFRHSFINGRTDETWQLEVVDLTTLSPLLSLFSQYIRLSPKISNFGFGRDRKKARGVTNDETFGEARFI
jgi:hypothetical protein